MYQLQTRISDILNYPLAERISQLRFCIETAPIKDLQSFYPLLVSNIFGVHTQNQIGWGLRTTTQNSPEYYLLYNFFNPHEAFFRLIYRLQSCGFVNKYELEFPLLPKGFKTMLESARVDGFYTKLISIDHFQPKMLSLNAFDFFILHFAIHATKNLHKISPSAMAVNNENTMTVYFNLVADYLCNFLPNDPNSVVYPQIDISPVKTPTAPVSIPMTPVKQPKYLLLSSLSHQIQNPTTHPRDIRLQEGTGRNSTNWRSETIMMFFIDCWLRHDLDESYELPSNEFIRILRILVKQLHYFGNSAEKDTSSLALLRQQSQNLLNARMYGFLKAVMARWPLDTSFLNVLELWLSYIQPFRYIYNRNIQNLNSETVDIPDRFKPFINENLLCYTQIFVRLIPRFMKMDLSLSKNAFMLFRMLKVFRQLSGVLREMERVMMSNNTGMRSHHSSVHDTSMHSHRSPNSSMNRSNERYSMHRYASQSALFDDSTYLCMFSDEVTRQVYELMQRVYAAKLKTKHEVTTMEEHMKHNITFWERFLQFIGWLSSLSFSFTQALEEKKKTPYYLDFILDVLSPMFNIPIEDATANFSVDENLYDESDKENTTQNSSLNITPSFMKSQTSRINYTGDPELLPIMSSEVKFLVRFLYQISSRLNQMFEDEFNAIWNKEGFSGRFARQILMPPVETRIFDKSAGYAELQVKQIGPRLSLRKLARKTFVMLLIASFITGRVFFGASSIGFMTFILITFIYLFVNALVTP